jgi:hydrophobe/amphiphile efflux-1 (HAE1) family protein
VRTVLHHRAVALAAFALMLAGVAWLLVRVPGSFVPPEDKGFVIAAAQLPDGATLERTGRSTERLRQMVARNREVKDIFVVNGFDLIGGGSKGSAATFFMTMLPWEQRKGSTIELAGAVTGMGFSALPDGIAFAFNPPPIQGLGQAGGYEVYVQARSDPDPQRLAQVTQAFMGALAARPELTPPTTFFRPQTPQLKVEVDREKALALGVPLADVFAALQAQMGSLYVNDFNIAGRTYRVTMQADAAFRARPDDLGRLYARSTTTGQMVPLKALISVADVIGPEQIERYNSYIAAKVLGNTKPGFSSGDGIAAVEQVARDALPPGYAIEWTGQAFQEKRTGNASVFAFGFALVMVYLILAALYERWGVPLAVVLAVPFAMLGALGFVFLRGMENDIYFQIGLVVLIGLAAKNAILIAEFAMQGMQAGLSAREAAAEAARLRFRPIVMTSLAFVFGVVPLVLATGAGAAARHSMGSGVFGGMIVATFVAPVFIPMFFTLLTRKPRPKHEHPPAGVHQP